METAPGDKVSLVLVAIHICVGGGWAITIVVRRVRSVATKDPF